MKVFETSRLLPADELLTQYDAKRKKSSKTRRKLCSNRLQSAAELCQSGEIFRRHRQQQRQTLPQVNPANSAKFQWRGRLIFVYNRERERRLTTDQKTHSKKKCAMRLNSWRNERRFMEFSGDFASDLDSNLFCQNIGGESSWGDFSLNGSLNWQFSLNLRRIGLWEVQ